MGRFRHVKNLWAVSVGAVLVLGSFGVDRYVFVLELRYEERIADLEARNTALQRDVDQPVYTSSHPPSSQTSAMQPSAELDGLKRPHDSHVVDLQQTIDDLRQQLLSARAKQPGAYLSVIGLSQFPQCIRDH